MLGTALAVLIGAGVAFAAAQFNTYKATENFCKSTPSSPTAMSCTPAAAGSTAHPAPVAINEHWQASGNGTNKNARPLTKIVVKQYGVKSNGQDFPTCTAAQINNAGNAKNWNAVCPKGSLIGGGPVSAELLSSSGTGAPAACNPWLYVYNGGKSTQTFLFAVGPQSPGGKYSCATAKTGTSCAAYTGSVKFANNVGTISINVPPCASTQAAGLTGVYASLHKLDVTYYDKTKSKGHYYLESVACKGKKRPYSTTFTASPFTQPPGQKPQTQTLNATAPCS
jgi:phage tail tape-measure protein